MPGVDIMDLVVESAARLASPGDVVLLAPAAASMDMFRDYGARGDAFAVAVERHRLRHPGSGPARSEDLPDPQDPEDPEALGGPGLEGGP